MRYENIVFAVGSQMARDKNDPSGKLYQLASF